MRKFCMYRDETTYWIFGEGTRNPNGDFYYRGEYEDLSIYTLTEMLEGNRAYEVIDPDMVMDEGL